MSTAVDVPPPSSSSSSGAVTQQHHHPNASILSDKVQRALQVRTDTPAMKAALDALAHLGDKGTTTTERSKNNDGERKEADSDNNNNNNNSSSSSNSESVVVDSRSVRVAIEQDALQQALLLQAELQTLVHAVAALRQGVTDTATITDRLYQGIQADVTTTLQGTPPPENVLLPPVGDAKEDYASASSTATTTVTTDNEGNPTPSQTAAMSVALEESQLARTLHDAFSARDQAKQRLAVVQAFLDKFDLSEEDSRLLDHYNFEDFDASMGETVSPVNGMAFLKALERVVHIRQALSESFGPSVMTSGGSNSNPVDTTNGAAGGSGGDAGGLGASSALRMMESLAQKQEQAYERLYHWLQNYLQLYASHSNDMTAAAADHDSEDRLDEMLSHPFCQLALATLQHVPAFYTHTLELIANARRSQATKQFLLALTSGYGGMPPLEMKAHDAVNYVGDMLAFCFRAFSVEADFARNMRALQVKNAQEWQNQHKSSNGNDSNEDGATGTEITAPETTDNELEIVTSPSIQPTISSKETLALTTSGVARPLKSRILQVIATLARSLRDEENENDDDVSRDSMMDDLEEEGSQARSKVTQLYEICGLLLFYASAMEHVEQKLDQPIGEQTSHRSLQIEHDEASSAKTKEETSPLMKAVLECLGEGTSAYEAALRVYAAMMEQLSLMSGESEAVLAHAIVIGIVNARTASPGFSEDVFCPKEFQTTLSMDWALEVILEASLNTCKTLDDAVMLQQAIIKTQKTGLSDTAQDLSKRIQDKESELIDALVAQETTRILDLCGLGTTATAWKNFKEAAADGGALTETMAAYPGLSAEEMQESVKEFYSSLYSPPLPSLETAIKDPVIRKGARRQIAQRVCNFYAEIYQAIMAEHANHAESGGYDDVSFLGHTPEQVITLFSA